MLSRMWFILANETGDVSVWWVAAAGAIGTIISAAVTAVVTILTTWSKDKQQRNKDALAEWKDIAERQQSDLDRAITDHRDEMAKMQADYRSVIDKLTAEHVQAKQEHMECKLKLVRMEGELKLQEATIRRLQRITGDEPPTTVFPGIIIADVQGIIKEATPALTSILHYMPHELRGKNVDILIPEKYKESHRKAMAAVPSRSMPPWPERVIVAEALTKEGEEVPVTIALSGWQTSSGDWLISAEVRQRKASGDSGILKKGGEIL